MANSPESGARIYDRPERKTISPVLVIVALLLLCLSGYFAYRAFTGRMAANPQNPPGVILVGNAFWLESASQERLPQYVRY